MNIDGAAMLKHQKPEQVAEAILDLLSESARSELACFLSSMAAPMRVTESRRTPRYVLGLRGENVHLTDVSITTAIPYRRTFE